MPINSSMPIDAHAHFAKNWERSVMCLPSPQVCIRDLRSGILWYRDVSYIEATWKLNRKLLQRFSMPVGWVLCWGMGVWLQFQMPQSSSEICELFRNSLVLKFRDNLRKIRIPRFSAKKALFRNIPRFIQDSAIFREKSRILRYRGDRGRIPPLGVPHERVLLAFCPKS